MMKIVSTFSNLPQLKYTDFHPFNSHLLHTQTANAILFFCFCLQILDIQQLLIKIDKLVNISIN